MRSVEKYLNEILGISVRLKDLPKSKRSALPFFLQHLYAFEKGELFERDIIFLKVKSDEPPTAAQLRKHSEVVEKTLNHPVVFVLPPIESYKRKRLIQKKVAFVIPGKQLFIPQLFIDLREYKETVLKKQENLLPAAQCLFLFHLLKKDLQKFNFKTIAEILGYTPMTVTRAVKTLERHGLAAIKGTKEKRIIFGADKKKLWKQAIPFLQTPVKKVYFLEYLPQANFGYWASFSALAHYTNLAEGETKYLAISPNDFSVLNQNKKIQIVHSVEARIHLQVWKYAPGVLANNQVVDPLSLYLSLKDEKDERVQKALDTLLAQAW